MRVLNAFAGFGGNLLDWTDCDVVAVSINENIAKEYQEIFPEDRVVVGDAFEHIRLCHQEYDFIWASPPCTRNSRCALFHERQYPDFRLYELIAFLNVHFKGPWCIENTISWFKPLIEPVRRGRHYLWSNFYIPEFNVEPDHIQKLAGGSPGRQKVNSIIGEVVYEQARKVIADGVDTKLFQFDWLYKCHHPALRY